MHHINLADKATSGDAASPGTAAAGRDPAGRDPAANLGPGTGGAAPPLLIGGVRQLEVTDIIGTKVDFFAATIGTQDAEKHLIPCTIESEPGYRTKGFKQSQRRECMGGTCWRKWEPYVASNAHGLEYESWEWDGGGGGGSQEAAESLRGVSVNVTRVDVAFDFSCSPDVVPELLVGSQQVQDHCKAIGIRADGVAGEGGCFTRYIGAKKGPLLLRIYRKDLQHEILGSIYGPHIRIELVMREHYAKQWWAIWNHSKQEAYTWAAAQIKRISSIEVMAGDLPFPEIVHPETRAAEPVLALIQQWSSIIVAAREAGIDLDALASAQVNAMSRAGKHRHMKRVEQLQRQDPAEVGAMVLGVINRK